MVGLQQRAAPWFRHCVPAGDGRYNGAHHRTIVLPKPGGTGTHAGKQHVGAILQLRSNLPYELL